MPLPKLTSNISVADRVFEEVHAAIMSGDLPPGHRLRIRELADELGTSVMPVREAIRRLVEIGLAETRPYRGAVVKDLSPEELLDVYAVRRLLEVEATRLGAGQVGKENQHRCASILTAMEEALANSQAAEYLDRDEEFLSFVYEAAGNPALLSTIRLLWKQCRPYKIVGAERELGPGDFSALLIHQQKLLEAIRSNDIEAAVKVTEASLDAAIDRIRDALHQPPSEA